MSADTTTPKKATKKSRKRTGRKTAKKAAKKRARKSRKASSKSTSPSASATRGKEWTFPKISLEDAIKVARAIEDKNAGNPMAGSVLVKAVGFNQTNDWRFRDMLRAANQYGLVSGTASASIELEKIGQDIVAPSSPGQRQSALLKAFRSVDVFKKVEEFYSGKKIPEDEYFENTLTREFGIPRDRVDTFIGVFTDNLKYLKLFDARKVAAPNEPGTSSTPSASDAQDGSMHEASRVREFLDSCFVMMPFGGWFDTYYKEIYAPAIKDAGFEPVRADELFTTGSVVEQIWEEVRKSRVLLADLSNKNPNVFYELGLAHAALKPVVFTSGSLDDVPFDLRHLRVIIYEVRQPGWDVSLRKSITDYLRNTRHEPAKSIPQPFRELAQDSEPEDELESSD